METAYQRKLAPVCNRLGVAALELMDKCELVVTEQGMLHPRILALALLSRTLSNLKGVAILTERGLAVEARTLARCCYENLFMVGNACLEGFSNG